MNRFLILLFLTTLLQCNHVYGKESIKNKFGLHIGINGFNSDIYSGFYFGFDYDFIRSDNVSYQIKAGSTFDIDLLDLSNDDQYDGTNRDYIGIYFKPHNNSSSFTRLNGLMGITANNINPEKKYKYDASYGFSIEFGRNLVFGFEFYKIKSDLDFFGYSISKRF